ncbi:hypothetical protein S7335_2315 [Synechococcus sp. PCC 7335]|uniref:cupredoxin domain-containing protein n=1 Tax=Synechococcus sp. (strain ATCC 29403 / PCC 7335) TaxID=91464 RepID=UPI00017EB8BE|nr:cupredoxin domain-containing protein [Synechococcus sp. PCC 7335]EDX84618.1 hypothetical protein S7335_2315 [Synechococcus sp. PCC 7335]
MQLQLSQNRRLRYQWLLCSLLTIGMVAGSTLTARARISEADTGEFLRIKQPLGLKAGVAVAGAGLIGLELWWFLLSKPNAQTTQTADGIQSIDITVDGGYSPNQIMVRAGQLVRLNFLRKDPSSCLERIILPDFNKAVDLPLNQTVTLEVVPEKAGDYTFHCGMNMFRGSITVKANVQ